MRALLAPVFTLLALTLAVPASAGDADDIRWNALRELLFADRPILDGAGVVALDAPYRAHDAAIVPITIRPEFAQTGQRHIKTVTLLIDQNPTPVAGRFHFTAASGIAGIRTRVRVNAYTNVRAIAETNDGQLYMTTRYVKASGGCSAPAGKDQDAALARMGKMKLRQSGPLLLDEPNEAQILISHPNNTGFQMDQLTRLYVPAHFVKTIEIRYENEPVLTVDSDISLSEDPSIHFWYVPRTPGSMSVKVIDNLDQSFTGSWRLAGEDS